MVSSEFIKQVIKTLKNEKKMARNYTITFSYKANITVDVTGDFHDEGEALDAARTIAEDADINEFSLGAELESRIVSTR